VADRNRPRAVALAIVYAALFGLAVYLESRGRQTGHLGGIDWWPTWALLAAGVTWGATMLVLPLLVVKYFFGMDLSRLRKFSLRHMMGAVVIVSLCVWYFTQSDWVRQRQTWLRDHGAIAHSTQGRPPMGLRWLFARGVAKIEITNGTRAEVAEAKRLFPEAEVVVGP
jgi:hypothetical protein